MIIRVIALVTTWTAGQLVEAANVKLKRDADLDLAKNYIQKPFSRRLGLVTVLSDGMYMERDRDSISLMNCFALRHGVPYYVETHSFGSNWYNKQLALRKYLPHFEWVLYVDADTYIMDRREGYANLLAYLGMLDAGGYHVAFSELHHSGAGGFDAGVVLIRNSAIGSRFNEEWLQGAKRAWRNADNGFLNLVFLRWVLGSKYSGSCDGLLHKYWYYPNGTASDGVMVKELSREGIRAYHQFFPCFYTALGLTWKPYESARMRITDASGEDGRSLWRPFYISYWDEPGILSCAYPRRVSGRMMHDPIPCTSPMIYHAKDARERFWSSRVGRNATNGLCI